MTNQSERLISVFQTSYRTFFIKFQQVLKNRLIVISARRLAGGRPAPKIQAEFSLSDLALEALTTTVEYP